MKLKVNGQEIEIGHPLPLTELLKELKIEASAIAIAVNTEVVPRSELAKRMIKSNDEIEIIHPVGGG